MLDKREQATAVQDKIIAALLVCHGAFGLAWTWVTAVNYGLSSTFVVTNMILAFIGIVSGVGLAGGRQAALLAGMLFYAVQSISIIAPSLQAAFTLGLNMTVEFGWSDSATIGINLLAVAMLLWLISRSFAWLKNSRRSLHPSDR